MRLSLLALLLISFAACSPDNVTEDPSLKEVFDKNGFQGSFGLFDNGKGDFIIYNLHQFTDSLYSPASTFKIVNSLIGLETGVVADSTSTIQTGTAADIAKNSFATGRSECDTILTMAQAFRRSCPNYYRELAQKLGVKTMQHYLDTLGYARKKGRFEVTDKNLTEFWLNNEVKVTADEQLGLMKRLYFDQLPFQKRTQRILRGMMLQEETPNYKLGYKTGTTDLNITGKEIGWMVGWIEENKHLFFFTLQVESKEDRDRADRIVLLKDILQKKGFLKGQK
jgi:beta-lactamase class D